MPATSDADPRRIDFTALRLAATFEGSIGLVPLVALVGSVGLVVVAIGDTAGRMQWPGAHLLFWLGYIALVAPFALRLLGDSAERSERILLVVLLGLGMFAVKLLNSPVSFTMFDEFLHWATLNDIVHTGRLFTPNNVLPASPFYPGLEITASAIVRSGSSVWDAGVLVVGAGRILLVLSLFLFVERATRSSWLAGTTTLAYLANPGALFFDGQFAYESLALPLALFVLFVVMRRERDRSEAVMSLTVALILGLAAVIVTHHVTSILLAVFLLTWAIVAILVRRLPLAVTRLRRSGAATPPSAPPAQSHHARIGLTGPALLAITGTTAWMLYIASVTVGYLSPLVGGAVSQMLDFVAGEENGRQLFVSAAGGASPFWEQLLGYASVAVLLVAMPVGAIVLWRAGRRNPAAVTLGLAALAYPATLAARFTAAGAELAARSAEFVFVGLGFVVALGALAIIRSVRPHSRALALAAIALMVIFTGGVVVGYPYWARVPGPYLVSADPRSIEPIGIDTASWMLGELGPDNRILADRDNRVLTKVYGRQHPLSAVGDQIDTKSVYFATTLDRDSIKLLARANVRYVLADERLPTSLPYTGVYVERGEIANGSWTTPMPAAALGKWDTTDGVDRIYDSGAIRIYDLRLLINAQP